MKISVIIPTFKRVLLLEKAVSSVMAQTYKNFECIVINDNWEDSKKIELVMKRFPNVKVLHQPVNMGGNAARNLGIKNTTGEIIAFLDDDDEWLPNKLERHNEVHTINPRVGLVYSNCKYVHKNYLVLDQSTSSKIPTDIVKSMGEGKFCPATSSIVSIKRGVIERCGMFDESMSSFQDWDFWFRIAQYFPFEHIPEVLVKYTQHLGDRVSQNEQKRLKGIDQICQKWDGKINKMHFRKIMLRTLYYHISLNALLEGNPSEFLGKSFRLLHPTVFGTGSVVNFINLWLHLLIRNRKRRLQFKIIL